MLNILVVEDDQTKLRKILEIIFASIGRKGDDVAIARDVNSAKRALKSTSFHLVILDIALPEAADKLPQPDAGIRLLRELSERNAYRMPEQIIGITAFDDIRESATAAFASELWAVIYYDAASDSWSDLLSRRLVSLNAAKSAPRVSLPQHSVDLCILTALEDPELSAILNLPWDWKMRFRDDDVSDYHQGTFSSQNGQKSAIAAAAPQMGMPAAAALAAKVIERFRPRFLIMAGIAAGFRGRCDLGDTLAADPVWDWGSGKFEVRGKKGVFIAAPYQLPIDVRTRANLRQLSRDQKLLKRIYEEFGGNKPAAPPHLHIGPVASGSSVLADNAITMRVAQQHRKLLGLEMESYGVYVAVAQSSKPQPTVLALKSVCDFADSEKSDQFQAYAAYTSANFVRAYGERYI